MQKLCRTFILYHPFFVSSFLISGVICTAVMSPPGWCTIMRWRLGIVGTCYHFLIWVSKVIWKCHNGMQPRTSLEPQHLCQNFTHLNMCLDFCHHLGRFFLQYFWLQCLCLKILSISRWRLKPSVWVFIIIFICLCTVKTQDNFEIGRGMRFLWQLMP